MRKRWRGRAWNLEKLLACWSKWWWFLGENKEEDLWEEEYQGKVLHLTIAKQHQVKKGPQQAPGNEKVVTIQQKYLVLKQLKKKEVSIWQLMVASQKQRQLLIDVLEKINFSPEATHKEMIALITTDKGTNTFGNEDFPPEGQVHDNIIYVTMVCLQKWVPLTLVNNRLSVNIYP